MIATPTTKGRLMAAQSGSKKDTTTVKTSTTSSAATGRPNAGSASSPQPTTQPTAAATARPAPSARSGIRLNLGIVLAAFNTGTSSRAVKAIQYALADRGFEPGNRDGRFDQATRDAYAKFQRSIHDAGDGTPTGYSLDYLGFDLI